MKVSSGCTDRQRVGLDGFRYFSSPKDGGGTNDNLARPLQHPLLPGQLQQEKIKYYTVEISFFTAHTWEKDLNQNKFHHLLSPHILILFQRTDGWFSKISWAMTQVPHRFKNKVISPNTSVYCITPWWMTWRTLLSIRFSTCSSHFSTIP